MMYDNRYYDRPTHEFWYATNGLLRPAHLAAVAYSFGRPFFGDEHLVPREPGRVLSIGCGTGFCERALEELGAAVMGVETSVAARKRYLATTVVPYVTFDALSEANTIIFCESVEHMTEAEVTGWLAHARSGTHLIVTNWLDHHPLPADATGWDHVTLIDDAYFERVLQGWDVLVARGSCRVAVKL